MNASRESFLQTEWKAYPAVPHHHDVKGRVDRLLVQYQIPEEWRELLRPGDWISGIVEKNVLKNICLLAPDFGSTAEDAISDQVWAAHAEFQKFTGHVREFFIRQSFFEVQTPSLVTSPGTEPYLDVFSSEFIQGRKKEKVFFPTSPELHLKKLLAVRGEPLFEISKCYRNGEISKNHQPEFWMLEFYQPFEKLDKIQQDVTDLVAFVAGKMKSPVPETFVTSMSELFWKKLQFKLTPETSQPELAAQALKVGLFSDSEKAQKESWDDLFFFLFLEKIERDLPGHQLLFIKDYPPSQAALARINERGWGDRFEVYWKGLELGNAFHELNDPKIQRQRFQEDLQKKKELGKESVPVDDKFICALERGMPPSSGIAIGLERLFMAISGYQQLSDFRLFPRV